MVPLHLKTSPTQNKIKNNTTYIYYHIYQLRAFFYYYYFFQFKKERLICSSILGLFPFGFIVLYIRVGGPIMYEKVVHALATLHTQKFKPKEENNEREMIFEANTKKIPFFFPPV